MAVENNTTREFKSVLVGEEVAKEVWLRLSFWGALTPGSGGVCVHVAAWSPTRTPSEGWSQAGGTHPSWGTSAPPPSPASDPESAVPVPPPWGPADTRKPERRQKF